MKVQLAVWTPNGAVSVEDGVGLELCLVMGCGDWGQVELRLLGNWVVYCWAGLMILGFFFGIRPSICLFLRGRKHYFQIVPFFCLLLGCAVNYFSLVRLAAN